VYRGPWINKSHVFIKKSLTDFPALFFQFNFGHQTLDSDSLEMRNPDSDSMNPNSQHCCLIRPTEYDKWVKKWGISLYLACVPGLVYLLLYARLEELGTVRAGELLARQMGLAVSLVECAVTQHDVAKFAF
jgi:hypothetical protein